MHYTNANTQLNTNTSIETEMQRLQAAVVQRSISAGAHGRRDPRLRIGILIRIRARILIRILIAALVAVVGVMWSATLQGPTPT